MIRYVVAALLTVAILGLAVLAIDDGASETTEREMQAEIAAIEAAAVDLEATEELSPAAHPNPQRVVEVSIPTRSLTRAGVSHVEIEPVNGTDASIARYVLDDGTRSQDLLETRIVYRDPTANRTTEIDGNGRQRLRLVLLPDENGGPVVVADPPARTDTPRVARPGDGAVALVVDRIGPSVSVLLTEVRDGRVGSVGRFERVTVGTQHSGPPSPRDNYREWEAPLRWRNCGEFGRRFVTRPVRVRAAPTTRCSRPPRGRRRGSS